MTVLWLECHTVPVLVDVPTLVLCIDNQGDLHRNIADVELVVYPKTRRTYEQRIQDKVDSYFRMILTA